MIKEKTSQHVISAIKCGPEFITQEFFFKINNFYFFIYYDGFLVFLYIKACNIFLKKKDMNK
jgi:hypothetical protein